MNAITETIRPIAPCELPAAVESLTAWQVTDNEYTLEQTFPQVYRPDGTATRFGCFEAGGLVSHTAVQTVCLASPSGDTRAGLIGAVATAPAARGRGLASRLLSEVIAWSRRRGLDSLLLWSQPRSLYDRLGFLPAGLQEEVLIRTRTGAHPPAGRPAAARDIVAIHHLHEKKPYRVRRRLQDTALLLSVAGMSTNVLERNGEVVAYVCCGKGADFPNWWHEMGGTDRDVADLFHGSMALGPNCTTLLLPPYRAGLKRLLGGSILRARTTYCALRLVLTAAGEREFFIDGLDSI